MYRTCQLAVFAVDSDIFGIVAEASAICLDGWAAGVNREDDQAPPRRMTPAGSAGCRIYQPADPNQGCGSDCDDGTGATPSFPFLKFGHPDIFNAQLVGDPFLQLVKRGLSPAYVVHYGEPTRRC